MENISIMFQRNHSYKNDAAVYYLSFTRDGSERQALLTLYKNSHYVSFESNFSPYRLSDEEKASLYSWFISQNAQRIRHILNPYTYEGNVPTFFI